jgi:hypothetical protein
MQPAVPFRRTLVAVSDNAPPAAEAQAELTPRRAAAQARVDQLEAEQRAATEAREAARAALVQAEREGVSSPRPGDVLALADGPPLPVTVLVQLRAGGAAEALAEVEPV